MRQLSSLSLCLKGCHHGVMIKAMDDGIVVSEFELQSHYYFHFQTNTLGKGMSPLYSILTSDLAKHAIPKTVEVLYSIGVGELGWQYGTGLKSHGTNWCTRREWPVNCMTVISARWRSNMPFQRQQKCLRDWVGVELLYNSVYRKFKEFLEIRRVGDKMR